MPSYQQDLSTHSTAKEYLGIAKTKVPKFYKHLDSQAEDQTNLVRKPTTSRVSGALLTGVDDAMTDFKNGVCLLSLSSE